MNATSRGLISGFLATGPMTYILMAAFRQLPEREKSPLPPATITDDGLKKVNAEPPDSLKPYASMAAHFAYGAVLALPYAFATSSKREHSLTDICVRGSVYGFGVWAANYAGILPAFGMRSRVLNMPPARNGMMIAAHFVWGVSMAMAEDWLNREGLDMLEGSRRAPGAE